MFLGFIKGGAIIKQSAQKTVPVVKCCEGRIWAPLHWYGPDVHARFEEERHTGGGSRCPKHEAQNGLHTRLGAPFRPYTHGPLNATTHAKMKPGQQIRGERNDE